MFFVISRDKETEKLLGIRDHTQCDTHTHTPHTKGERGRVFFHFHIDLKKGLLKRCCRTDGHSIFSERDKRERGTREREKKKGEFQAKKSKNHTNLFYTVLPHSKKK